MTTDEFDLAAARITVSTYYQSWEELTLDRLRSFVDAYKRIGVLGTAAIDRDGSKLEVSV